MAYMRLGDLLIAAGAITQEQLEEALTIQKQKKERLGDVLIESNIITERQLIEALQMQLGVDFIDLTGDLHSVGARQICAACYREKIQRGAGKACKRRALCCHERSVELRCAGRD